MIISPAIWEADDYSRLEKRERFDALHGVAVDHYESIMSGDPITVESLQAVVNELIEVLGPQAVAAYEKAIAK